MSATIPKIPILRAGDHLSLEEFERRYRVMKHVKAELIEGVVFMPSPVRADAHGDPHFDVIGWLGGYRTATPGVRGSDNATVRLPGANMPQPDAHLRMVGGSTTMEGGYVVGPPELVVEIAASTANYDLHEKLRVYEKFGVREYLVWRVEDGAFDWFVLREGAYVQLPPGDDGILRTEVFPGLWLDPVALLREDYLRVDEVLRQGLASPEHQEFVALQRARIATEFGS